MNTAQEIMSFLEKRNNGLTEKLASSGVGLPPGTVLGNCVRKTGSGLSLPSTEKSAPEVDENKATATFVISTLKDDRVGDVVIPKGCVPHLKNYESNPRVFFSHKSHEMPIGNAREGKDGPLCLWADDYTLKSTCHFHLKTAESELVFRMVADGDLQTASIGFLPVKAAVLEPKKEPNRPETNEEGEDLIYFKDGGWFSALKFHEWDLTEWSVVPVPMNPEAIACHLSRGVVGGIPLTDNLKQCLEPYRHERKFYPVSEVVAKIPQEEKEGIKSFEAWWAEHAHEDWEQEPWSDYVKGKLKVSFPFTDEEPTEVVVGWEEVADEAIKLCAATFIAKEKFLEEVLADSPKELLMKKGGDAFSHLVDKELEELIPAPEHAEKETASEPTPEESDCCLPLGVKFLQSFCGWCIEKVQCTEETLKELEHPRVCKLANKMIERLCKLERMATKLGSECYPDHFEYESPEGSEEEAMEEEEKQLEVVPQLTEKDSERIHLALANMILDQKALSKTFFEATGRELPIGE